MGIVVTNIQRMCFQDGPGVRTTVFLKGCGIHCPWCANPENISFGCNEQYGREYEVEELRVLLKKDIPFWGEEGGITFSGGEPMLHVPALLELWKDLKKQGIHLVMETSLFAPTEYVEKAIEYMDFFYVDIKLLEPELCERVLGGKVEQYLKNLALLAEGGAEIHFRIPCSEEYVLQPSNLGRIYTLLEKYSKYPVELFAVHNLGDSKYRKLGLEPNVFREVPEIRLLEVKDKLEKLGVKAKIIKL